MDRVYATLDNSEDTTTTHLDELDIDPNIQKTKLVANLRNLPLPINTTLNYMQNLHIGLKKQNDTLCTRLEHTQNYVC